MSNAGKQPYRCAIKSSTGQIAVKNSAGKIKVYSADDSTIVIPVSQEIVIWSCAQGAPEGIEPEPTGKIQSLVCSKNYLRELDITGLPSLEILDCSHNELEYLWLFGPLNSGHEGPRNLLSLDCSYNSIVELDVSELRHIHDVKCSDNKLKSLRLGKALINLTSLDCSNNRLSVMDLAGLIALQSLNAQGNLLRSNRNAQIPDTL
jgi:Leucine-rich repeat (LRR) protein